MTDQDSEAPTPEQIERRLNELAQLYELGMALREVRFEAPPAAEVREGPRSSAPDANGGPANRERRPGSPP